MDIVRDAKYTVTMHYRGLMVDETKRMTGQQVIDLTQSNPSSSVDVVKDTGDGVTYNVTDANGFRYKKIYVRRLGR